MMTKKIVIDPGHGGPDDDTGGTLAGGCYLKENYSEDDWNLDFCHLLAPKLTAAGFDVKMTREEDVYLHRNERRLFHGDLILSIHVNTIYMPTASGLIVFRYPGNERMERLAHLVLERTPSQLCRHSLNNFVTKKDDWTARPHRVVCTWPEDVLLVEVGFASNPSDLQYLLSDSGQTELACALTAALVTYFKE
jgi:N-acetylmuramoyl-L-alanine amidase